MVVVYGLSKSTESQLDREYIESMSQQDKINLFWGIIDSYSQQVTKEQLHAYDADVALMIEILGFNPVFGEKDQTNG